MIKNMRVQDLLRIMEKNHWTKARMARMLNISYTQINRYFNGSSIPGGLNNIEKIDKFITEHK